MTLARFTNRMRDKRSFGGAAVDDSSTPGAFPYHVVNGTTHLEIPK